MDQQINTLYNTRARAELAEAFRFLAAQGSASYPDWVPGPRAARSQRQGRLQAGKASLSGCHDDYQSVTGPK